MKIYLLCVDPDNGNLDDVVLLPYLTRAAVEEARDGLIDDGSESVLSIRELLVCDVLTKDNRIPVEDDYQISPSPDPRESFECDPHDLEDFGGRGVEPR